METSTLGNEPVQEGVEEGGRRAMANDGFIQQGRQGEAEAEERTVSLMS